MWPLDRSASAEVLRIGRQAVERWKSVDGKFSLSAVHALPQDTAPQSPRLEEAVAMLYPTVPKAAVTLVLESAWLPVVLVDTGATLLRLTQVDALVRHRFRLQYSDAPDSLAVWELRIEQRAGNRYALAYGMRPRLKQGLIDAARAVGLEWAAMTPALAWGIKRSHLGKALPRSTGWFAWPEQDRTLVARLVSNEVAGLNSGAPCVADETNLLGLIAAEDVRLGIASTSDLIVAPTWGPVARAARAGERVVWLDVLAPNRPRASPSFANVPQRLPA